MHVRCLTATATAPLVGRVSYRFRPDARSTDGEDASPPKKSRLDTDNSDEALNAVLDHVLSKWARHPHAWSRCVGVQMPLGTMHFVFVSF